MRNACEGLNCLRAWCHLHLPCMLLPYLKLCQGLQLRQRLQAPSCGQRVQIFPDLPEALPGRLRCCLAPATLDNGAILRHLTERSETARWGAIKQVDAI